MSEVAIAVKNNVNLVSNEEWVSLDTSVRNTAIEIAKSIKEAHEKIAKAKELAEEAPNTKGGFLGIGRQKNVNTALSKAQVATNNAMYDLSELVQQSIKFTLSSLKTASNMQKALAYLAVNGIRDANGRVETLSSECTESINLIIEQAEDFIQQQMDIEKRQNELKGRMEDKETKDREQDNAIRGMEEALMRYSENSMKLESEIEKNTVSIKSLYDALLDSQNTTEGKIIKLETELREIMTLNKKLDEEERIRLRDEYLADIQKLKLKFVFASGSIAVIAGVALILSIVL